MKFAVIGLGLFGKRIAKDLAEMGHDVLAIDRDEQPVDQLKDKVNKAIIGDVTQEGLIEELITENMDVVIVTMATDIEGSLISVLNCKEIGVGRVVAKSNGYEHTKILEKLGIDKIINPEEDVADQLAKSLGNPKVQEYLQLGEDYSLREIEVPETFVGKTLQELDVRSEHKVQVIGIQRHGTGNFDYVPSPTEPFHEDDIVCLTGPDDKLDALV